MNKIMCYLTGGHNYEEKNVLMGVDDRRMKSLDMANYCTKCGKAMYFSANIEQIKRELSKTNNSK